MSTRNGYQFQMVKWNYSKCNNSLNKVDIVTLTHIPIMNRTEKNTYFDQFTNHAYKDQLSI